jgi:hypothetical protein
MMGDKCNLRGGKVRTDLLPAISDRYSISELGFRIQPSEFWKNILVIAMNAILESEITYFILFPNNSIA